jgi:hypothetical protein
MEKWKTEYFAHQTIPQFEFDILDFVAAVFSVE